MKQKAILAQRAQSYEQLQKQLHRLPLLAQGNVFAIDTPPGAPRAATHYMWTRKVKNKTITKALSKEQNEVLKEAIEANREVENILRQMRTIAQEAILKSLPDSRGKRKPQKRPKGGLS